MTTDAANHAPTELAVRRELCKARRIIACAFEQQAGAGILVGLQFCFGKGAVGRFQAASTTLRQFGNGAQGFNRAAIPLQQQAECHGADIRCADQPETGKFFLAVHPACIGE